MKWTQYWTCWPTINNVRTGPGLGNNRFQTLDQRQCRIWREGKQMKRTPQISSPGGTTCPRFLPGGTFWTTAQGERSKADRRVFTEFRIRDWRSRRPRRPEFAEQFTGVKGATQNDCSGRALLQAPGVFGWKPYCAQDQIFKVRTRTTVRIYKLNNFQSSHYSN